MSDFFDIGDMAGELDQLSKTGQDAIRLPFTAPIFYWSNAQSGAVAGAGSEIRVYGGWSTNENEMQAIEGGVPDKFVYDTFASRQSGNTYNVYTARQLAVAVMAMRKRWAIDRDKPGDTGKGHHQYLCLAALYDSNTKIYTAWNPVVLSCKGRHTMSAQVNSIAYAIDAFARNSMAVRTKHANSAKPNLFYFHLGTFGKEVHNELVGKSQKSPITLCYSWPRSEADFTEEWLRRAFVGRDTAAYMVELLRQAQEWLHAWDKLDGDDQQPDGQQQQYRQRSPAQQQRGKSSGNDNTPPEPEFPF